MPPPRLPTPSDFPPNVTLTITPPPNSTPPTNVLLLLHGLGDTHHPFTSLSKNLNLPETVCISLRGPNPIPPLFAGEHPSSAFHWGDDLIFDEGTGHIDLDAGWQAFRKVVMELVVEEGLVEKCGYERRNVQFFGFGQGGMGGLVGVASSLSSKSSHPLIPYEYGGLISIGACLPSSFTQPSSTPKNKTPILILGSSRSSEVTKEKLEVTRNVYENVEYVKWDKDKDSMPGSREEMLPIMKFWARRLRSRAGVPEGASEIG